MRLIDRQPPAPTGDTARDVENIYSYLAYLMEQINFILTNLNREGRNNG